MIYKPKNKNIEKLKVFLKKSKKNRSKKDKNGYFI